MLAGCDVGIIRMLPKTTAAAMRRATDGPDPLCSLPVTSSTNTAPP
jgi:hypothetical protein